MSMELRIITPQENWIAQGIQWNSEELKAAIAEKIRDFKSLQYTEETIKEAKKDKANLNKLRTALEDERKRIKKECMQPYEAFEKQVKEIVSMIDEPIRLIDAQIKEVEEQRRIEKKGQVFAIYEGNIGTLKGILPFEKVFKEEYLNVSRTLKSIREEITALIQKVNSDMDTIDELHTKFELQVKDMYIRTLDLSAALRENNRLIEVEKRLAAEREQKRQLEEQRAAQLRQRAVEADMKATPPVAPISEPKPEEKRQWVKFQAYLTTEDAIALKEFFDSRSITFKAV